MIKKKREFVTKEIFIAITPLIASSLWTIFYEAGYANYYGIPYDFINLNITDIFLTNRLSLLAAAIGFLWIGLYYNLMPSFRSLLFKIIITLFLIFSIAAGASYGFYQAKNAKSFYYLSTTPPQVVLRIYGDKMISAPVDLHHQTVKKSFYVHVIGKNPDLKMTLKNLGPLRSF